MRKRTTAGTRTTVNVGRKVAGGLVAAALLLGACSKGEAPTLRYPSAREAPAGSLPVWLPAAAADVVVQESPGTKALWVRFRLPAAEREAFAQGLARIPDGQIATLTVSRPSGADWWFARLAEPGKTDASALAADVYSGTGTPVPLGTFVALDRASDSVYAWGRGK